MVGRSVRGIMVFGVVAVAAAFSLSVFLGDATGEFLEILRMGEAGVKLAGLAFIPMGLYLAYKSVQ